MMERSSQAERGVRHMLDRYEVIAQIASGGMGTVFLARLEGVGGFQRLCALKLMHPHLAQDPQFVAMLLDEAKLAARIHHPNAVSILDVCESERGYYLVMEYVEGFTLEDILCHPDLDATTRIRLGLRVLYDGATGLHAAHELKDHDGQPFGLVHRDVSPQNILVGVDGIGRITDFGVARAAARITTSRPGMIKGKPSYMAPEQARGEEIDRRTDTFALGIIFWEVLTGEQLFYSEAGEAAMLVRVMYDEVRKPSERNPDVPPELDAIAMKALDRKPENRFQSARAFCDAVLKAASKLDLIATHNDLADRMQTLFHHDITERRASIQRHIAELGEPNHRLASDVFDVPKLAARPSLAPPPPNPPNPKIGTADTTGRRALVESSGPVKTQALLASELPRPNLAAEPARSNMLLRVGIALIVVGLLTGAAVAVWQVAKGPSAESSNELPETTSVEPEMREPIEPEMLEAEMVEPEMLEPEMLEPEMLEAEIVETAEVGMQSAMRSDTRMTGERPRMTETMETEMETETMVAPVERNPYLQ
jgi:serine/threonine protein kinase